MSNLSAFKQGFLGGLAALVVAALIFVAGAVAAQEGIDPVDETGNSGRSNTAELPTVLSPNAVDSTGGVLTVFQTTATYNGAGPAGYGRSAMYAACRLEDPSSHFCTIQEIEMAWKTTGIDMLATGQAWIDNAIVGTVENGYNGDATSVSDWYGGNATGDHPYNCNAWTNNLNAARGLILNDGAISPATEACDDIHPIACCK
jgi:hypothetical protein